MPTLNFKGKTFVQNHHLAVKYHQLVPDKHKSLTDKVSLHDNLIIHGDNLLALKALLPTYAGKVKCIYIDPPYNTGNEGWAYNDNVRSPMLQQWLGKTVDKDDLTRHDKWLCMIMPRLKLLRELLSDDGVIFVSIDDNEVHNLRCLLDEVFGRENLFCEFVWKSRQYIDSRAITGLSNDHEYVLSYCKSETGISFQGLPRDETKYSNPDNDFRGDWMSRSILGLANKEQRPNLHYDLIDPKTDITYPCPPNTGWRYSRQTMDEKIADNRILFPKKKNGRPREKVFLNELQTSAAGFPSVIDNVFTADGSYEIRSLFGKQAFDFPKPSLLLAQFFQQINDSGALILDSFAGSGTTAHAVIDLNRDDGGNRKFILIEQEDYADSITAERVRRVIARTTEGEGTNGAGKETFSFFRLGDPIEMESILKGDSLPPFEDLARYVFYTATGEEFDESGVDDKCELIGESSKYLVYMLYKPDIEYLKRTALTLDWCRALPEWKIGEKRRLVFAPAKFVDDETASLYGVDFCQLPYEIYRLQK